MMGCCFSLASRKNPTTQDPSTRNGGVLPNPSIEGVVVGAITNAHGKSSVGISVLFSV